MLRFRYSCIYEAHMSPTLNESSVIRHFEGSNATKIRNEISFDFYTGLPHITMKPVVIQNGQGMKAIVVEFSLVP